MDKKLVIPGEFLSDEPNLADEGTYVEDGKVFSSVFGIASTSSKNQKKVVPLSGKYIPQPGDVIIGTISEVTFSNWIVDIRSPYEGLLHISEFPRRIDNSEMSKFLKVGDSIMTVVKDVDSIMKVELTLNDQRTRHLQEGRIIEVTPSKVPRLIGRNGSMIAMLKSETKCSIFIGQNGRVWITGKDRDIDFAVRAIMKIERESHISGLTERMSRYLKEKKGEKIKEEKKEEVEKVIEKEVEQGKEENFSKEEEEEVIEKESEEKETQEKSGGILDELLEK